MDDIKEKAKEEYIATSFVMALLFEQQHGRPPKAYVEAEKLNLQKRLKKLAERLLDEDQEDPCLFQVGFILLYLSKTFKDIPDIPL